MATLTEKQKQLLEGKNFAVVATLKSDGSPQTSVVWIDTDGENLVFNTTNARAKARHLRRDPRLSVTVWDAEDPNRYVTIDGTATLDESGAAEHIHELSRRYTGRDFQSPTDRVIVRVRPERVREYGLGD